ncbi:MAG: hypothetical protein AAGH79_01990 [Bacteroidota bacterium]
MSNPAHAALIPPHTFGLDLQNKLIKTWKKWSNGFGRLAVFGEQDAVCSTLEKLARTRIPVENKEQKSPQPRPGKKIKKLDTILLSLPNMDEENRANALFKWMVEISPYLKADTRLIIESNYSPKKIEFLVRNMLPTLVGEQTVENIQTAYVTIAPDPYGGCQRFFSSQWLELNHLASRMLAGHTSN